MKNFGNIFFGHSHIWREHEDAHNYAHNMAQKKADELGEDIQMLEMRGDRVEIYGINDESKLSKVEDAFYKALKDANEPITKHMIDGVEIEVETDAGNWRITEVKVNGQSYNVHDTVNPSTLVNLSDNSELDELLEEGIELVDALEKVGAEWVVRIYDDTYAYIPMEKKDLI